MMNSDSEEPVRIAQGDTPGTGRWLQGSSFYRREAGAGEMLPVICEPELSTACLSVAIERLVR
jgi:hypothetical protein